MVGGISSLHAVILQQVSQHCRAGQIVDCHDLTLRILKYLSECQTSDTSKSIDCNFSHFVFLLLIMNFIINYIDYEYYEWDFSSSSERSMISVWDRNP